MAAGARGRGSSISVGEGTLGATGAPSVGSVAGSQGPMLQFFTKLRRHASLEGASPYLKIKKWKLDSSQRASSLDTRGTFLTLKNAFSNNHNLKDLLVLVVSML